MPYPYISLRPEFSSLKTGEIDLQLSTKGRYGSRAMLDLALRYGQGPIMVREIAGRQQLSEKYLEQILSELRKAGLVISFQGKKGGFKLARPPEDITLREVLEVLEGSFAPVRCVEDKAFCKRSDACSMRDVWENLRTAQVNVLDEWNLEKLMKFENEKLNNGVHADYCI